MALVTSQCRRRRPAQRPCARCALRHRRRRAAGLAVLLVPRSSSPTAATRSHADPAARRARGRSCSCAPRSPRGALGRRTTTGTSAEQSTRAERAWASLWRPQPIPTAQRVLLPLAVVSIGRGGRRARRRRSAALPRRRLLVGAFFAVRRSRASSSGPAPPRSSCTRTCCGSASSATSRCSRSGPSPAPSGCPAGCCPAPRPSGRGTSPAPRGRLSWSSAACACASADPISRRLPAWPEWHIAFVLFVGSSRCWPARHPVLQRSRRMSPASRSGRSERWTPG